MSRQRFFAIGWWVGRWQPPQQNKARKVCSVFSCDNIMLLPGGYLPLAYNFSNFPQKTLPSSVYTANWYKPGTSFAISNVLPLAMAWRDTSRPSISDTTTRRLAVADGTLMVTYCWAGLGNMSRVFSRLLGLTVGLVFSGESLTIQ